MKNQYVPKSQKSEAIVGEAHFIGRLNGDDYVTPPQVWNYLKDYLDKSKTYYEPFYLDGFSGEYLKRELGLKVIHEKIDFFHLQNKGWLESDVVISNPPFSLASEIVETLVQQNKPFALLLPMRKIALKKMNELFNRKTGNQLQLLILGKTIQYFKYDEKYDEYEIEGKANFESVFLCWKFLPMPFIILEKPTERIKTLSPAYYKDKWKMEDEEKSECKNEIDDITERVKEVSVSDSSCPIKEYNEIRREHERRTQAKKEEVQYPNLLAKMRAEWKTNDEETRQKLQQIKTKVYEKQEEVKSRTASVRSTPAHSQPSSQQIEDDFDDYNIDNNVIINNEELITSIEDVKEMTDTELLENKEIVDMLNDEIENETIIEEVMDNSGLTEKELVILELYKYCSIQDLKHMCNLSNIEFDKDDDKLDLVLKVINKKI